MRRFRRRRHVTRAVKNRFGSTNEIGIFEMQSGGLVEDYQLRVVFLEERLDGATGSSIAMEGHPAGATEGTGFGDAAMFGNAKRTRLDWTLTE